MPAPLPLLSSTLASSTILPGWIVVPLAAATMLVIAAHVLAVHQSDLPLRKRRIRLVNGMLMLVITALLAYALGMAEVVAHPAADPAGTREFVTVWITIIGLLGVVVSLAVADALHSVMSGWAVRKQLRQELRADLSGDLKRRRAAEAPTASPTALAGSAPASRREGPRGG